MPLHDDIGAALVLGAGGGSASLTTTGATLQTNENTVDLGFCGSAFPSLWLEVDLSALVGMGGGKTTTITVAQTTGPVEPYLQVWWDITGTFDPSVPDFTLLTNAGDSVGNGTATPLATPFTFRPDADGNPSGLYWIWVGDFNCTDDTGDLSLAWTAFTDVPDCVNGIPVGAFDTTPFDQITSHSAHAHFHVCPGGALTTLHVDLSISPTFSTTLETINLTLPAGNSNVPIDLLLTDGCTGLSPSTTYYVRVRGSNTNGFLIAFSSSFATIAEPGTPPANDDIGSAQTITGASGSTTGDDWNATEETGEHTALFSVDHTLYNEAPDGNSSVWFKWTAPATMDVAFWTVTPDFTLNGREGNWKTIISVLDGSNFGTATVVAQNEFAQGQPAPFAGSQFPHSLVQFHATNGVTYYIGVDCDSSGCQGPFGLKWGAPVDAFPAVRACSATAVTDTTATFQFDINPQSLSGFYWVGVFNPSFGETQSPHGTPSQGYEWQTVTRTVTGLQPNTPYGSPTYGGSTGQNLAWCDNPTFPGETDGASSVCDGIYTLMPIGQFGICAPVFDDPFTAANCTIPTDWSCTDGYRVQGNAMAAYVFQADNEAVASVPDTQQICWTGGCLIAADLAITLKQVAGKQDVGWECISGAGLVGKYFVRSDAGAGELEIVRWDESDDSEHILASAGFAAGDGDQIGIRYETASQDITAWTNTGGGWTLRLTAHDTTYGLAGYDFIPFIAQSATPFDQNIDPSLGYNLSIYGTTGTSAPIFPPFSCPDNSPKYSWVTADYGGGLSWIGPYYGGTNPNDLPPRTCPVWWLAADVGVAGYVDCYNGTFNAGSAGFYQTALSNCGVVGGLTPFYPNAPGGYATEIACSDGQMLYGTPRTFDSDAGEKAMAAVDATLDLLQAHFAADGAFVAVNTYDSGKTAEGLFMPVAVAPGRIDNFLIFDERCAPPTPGGIVSLWKRTHG